MNPDLADCATDFSPQLGSSLSADALGLLNCRTANTHFLACFFGCLSGLLHIRKFTDLRLVWAVASRKGRPFRREHRSLTRRVMGAEDVERAAGEERTNVDPLKLFEHLPGVSVECWYETSFVPQPQRRRCRVQGKSVSLLRLDASPELDCGSHGVGSVVRDPAPEHDFGCPLCLGGLGCGKSSLSR